MSDYDKVALVLSGGNALGAYQAGAYQALQERGIEPNWIATASAGAINGALICGNPGDRRVPRLEEYWQSRAPDLGEMAGLWSAFADVGRRTAAANLTLATGRPGIFTPRHIFGPLWEPFGNPEPASLYDTTALGMTLDRLVDFDLLNGGGPRFSATAVDLESGEDVVFDTGQLRITTDHLRASSALLPAFPPVEIEGRLCADAGISANLPLDVVLSRPPAGRLLCISLDLLPLEAPRPATLGDAICRMQDLMFATQSRRALAAWQGIFDARLAAHAAGGGEGEIPSITVLQLSYADQGQEVSGKAFDFSPASVRGRWAAGYRDVASALDQLERGIIAPGAPGLTIYRPENGAPADRATVARSRPTLSPLEL
jgi:NTE family protein